MGRKGGLGRSGGWEGTVELEGGFGLGGRGRKERKSDSEMYGGKAKG